MHCIILSEACENQGGMMSSVTSQNCSHRSYGLTWPVLLLLMAMALLFKKKSITFTLLILSPQKIPTYEQQNIKFDLIVVYGCIAKHLCLD